MSPMSLTASVVAWASARSTWYVVVWGYSREAVISHGDEDNDGNDRGDSNDGNACTNVDARTFNRTFPCWYLIFSWIKQRLQVAHDSKNHYIYISYGSRASMHVRIA